jgi:hypothetical protein
MVQKPWKPWVANLPSQLQRLLVPVVEEKIKGTSSQILNILSQPVPSADFKGKRDELVI